LHAVVDVVQRPPTQHASLHGELSEQVVPHVCVDASHAWPYGQSAATLHPQPPATHALPFASNEQSLHVPEPPHVLPSVPFAQRPFASQQPVAHGLVSEHGFSQVCVVVSQMVPDPQSVFTLHPHAPTQQMWPSAAATQLVQAPPPVPHFAAEGCALHVSPSQHPLQFDALHLADAPPPSFDGGGGVVDPSSSPEGCDGSVLAAGSVGVSVVHAARTKRQAKKRKEKRRSKRISARQTSLVVR